MCGPCCACHRACLRACRRSRVFCPDLCIAVVVPAPAASIWWRVCLYVCVLVHTCSGQGLFQCMNTKAGALPRVGVLPGQMGERGRGRGWGGGRAAARQR